MVADGCQRAERRLLLRLLRLLRLRLLRRRWQVAETSARRLHQLPRRLGQLLGPRGSGAPGGYGSRARRLRTRVGWGHADGSEHRCTGVILDRGARSGMQAFQDPRVAMRCGYRRRAGDRALLDQLLLVLARAAPCSPRSEISKSISVSC